MKPWRVETFSFVMGKVKDELSQIQTPSSLEDLDIEDTVTGLMGEIDTAFRVTSLRFGSVYGFTQEQNGRTVQNLFPIKSNEDSQISSSSGSALDMHTEAAFHPWRPEVVLLLCIREDPNAGTTLTRLEDVLKHLDAKTVETLHHPEFVTEIDESFRTDGTPNKEILTPVLFDDARSMTYDKSMMRGTNKQAQDALDRFSDAVDAEKTVITLKYAEILIIDNRVVVHGRTPFKARYDGTDRWIKRTMVSTKLPGWDQMEIRRNRFKVVTTTF